MADGPDSQEDPNATPEGAPPKEPEEPEQTPELEPDEVPEAPAAAPPPPPPPAPKASAEQPAPEAEPAPQAQPAAADDQMDLSAFDDEAPQLGSPLDTGSDDDALKKINQHTSPFGRIVTILIIVGVAGLAGMYLWSSQKAEEQRERLEKIGQMQDASPEEVTQKLRNLYPEVDSPELKRRILMNLGHYRDEQAVDIYMKGLDGSAPVRRAAAWALARVGSPAADKAKPKLLEVLPKTDEKDRAQVTWTLALLGEEKASDAIIEQFSKGLLQNLDGFDPKVITEVLGPQKLSSEDLLNHESESVRRLTAHALAEAASAEVVAPLSRLLDFELEREGDDRSQEVIRAAAAGLGRTGSPKAARPLFNVLKEEPGLKQAVIEALRRSTAAPDLVVLAKEATDDSVKRELVRLIAETHDPRVADALHEWTKAEDAEIRETAAFALADLGDERGAPMLIEIARDEESGSQDRALGALQKVASPAISDQLVEMKAEMDYRLASILRIMAKTGDQDLGPEIEEALDSADVGAAAVSLAELGYEPAYDKLLDMVERPRDVEMGARNAAERSLENEDLLRSRKGAIQAMGYYGKPEAFDALVKVVEDDVDEDYELRAIAAQAIGRLASAEQIATIISKIKDESLDERSRRYYVQALWQKPHPELNDQMLALIGDGEMPIPVRRAAALAVGYTADPATDDRLVEMLGNEDTARHAAIALTLGGGREAASQLVDVLAENNDVREILQQSLMNDQTDWFNLLTMDMLEGGQFFRRLQAGDALREGDEEQSFGYAWAKAVAIMRNGWGGPDGARPRHIRSALYAALTGDDESKQRIAGEALAGIPERGLLLRARDEGGAGSDIARELLKGSEKK